MQALAGGALQLAAATAFVSHNNTFTSNTAQVGGSVAAYAGSSFVCTSCNFTANSAAGSGGAIAALQAKISLSKSLLAANVAIAVSAQVDFVGLKPAGVGGGMFLINGSLALNDMVLLANRASSSGGGVYLVDGLFAATNGVFSSNRAVGMGGAVFLASATCRPSVLTFQGTVLLSNSAWSGGAIAHIGTPICASGRESLLVLKRVTLESNTAMDLGGALFTSSTGLSTEACKVLSNVAGQLGGGVVAGYMASVQVSNSSFTGNAAASGGALAVIDSKGKSSISNSSISGNYAFVHFASSNDTSNTGFDGALAAASVPQRPMRPRAADVATAAKLQDASRSSLTAWPKCGDIGAGGGLCITPGEGSVLLSATEVSGNVAMLGGKQSLCMYPQDGMLSFYCITDSRCMQRSTIGWPFVP
jgi:predicted outer membrane repeat protein